MTPQELKNSILQLAIQGKLVEQRAEEGTGKELLEKILAAKNAEGAKKNLTQRRRDAEATKEPRLVSNVSRPVEDSPFDIPESWEWVRLKEITTKITDGTHHSPPNQETGDFMYVTAKNIKDEGVIVSNITYVSADVHAEIFARCNPELGDILLIKDGATTGVVTVNNIDRPFSLLSSVALLKLPENICAWYLVYALRSDLFYKLLRKQMKGTGITRITLKQIEPLHIPLPPLAEQKRIVAKIEELMPLVERYEKAWCKLKDFNKSFPVDMQKSILQMAIQGKLVEQRAEEGTGRELLEKILAAKNAKDAEKGKGKGRLTRSRGERGDAPTSAPSASPRDEIPDDEKPFDIPDSWEWVRLEFAANVIPSKEYQILESEVLSWGRFPVVSQSKEYSIGFTDNSNKVYCHSSPVIIFGDHTTEVKFVEFDFVVGADGVKIFAPEFGVYEKFLFFVLQFHSRDLKKVGGYSRHYKFLKNKPIPLPPLAEQKRIVAKIEELLPLCDRLIR